MSRRQRLRDVLRVLPLVIGLTVAASEALAGRRVAASPEPQTSSAAQTPGPEPQAPNPEIVAEVRVHGNIRIPDAEILKLAGIAVGAPLPDTGVTGIEDRLRASGRFESVEVRKRFRSLTATEEVALILLRHFRPSAPLAASDRPAPSARQADSRLHRRLRLHLRCQVQHGRSHGCG
jgi:POTRA domain, FtsQ-type